MSGLVTLYIILGVSVVGLILATIIIKLKNKNNSIEDSKTKIPTETVLEDKKDQKEEIEAAKVQTELVDEKVQDIPSEVVEVQKEQSDEGIIDAQTEQTKEDVLENQQKEIDDKTLEILQESTEEEILDVQQETIEEKNLEVQNKQVDEETLDVKQESVVEETLEVKMEQSEIIEELTPKVQQEDIKEEVKNESIKEEPLKEEPLKVEQKNEEQVQESKTEVNAANKVLKFLVVDDANFMRILMKKIITDIGYKVVGEAENGRQAIELTKELSPDIVTLDITMPDINGIDALKEILEFNPNIKVIMCSAIDRRDMVIKSLQMGAKDFISKPFDENRAKEVIKRVVSL